VSEANLAMERHVPGLMRSLPCRPFQKVVMWVFIISDAVPSPHS